VRSDSLGKINLSSNPGRLRQHFHTTTVFILFLMKQMHTFL